MGPIFQIIFYLLISFLGLNTKLYSIIHNSILLFNLLPIIPLDGFKIIRLVSDKIFSLKLSYIISSCISIFTLFILVIYSLYTKQLIIILITLFLIKSNIKNIKEYKMYFIKFLLERYQNNFNFKKTKYIKNINLNKIKRDYKHLFYNGYFYQTEKEILKKKFDLS